MATLAPVPMGTQGMTPIQSIPQGYVSTYNTNMTPANYNTSGTPAGFGANNLPYGQTADSSGNNQFTGLNYTAPTAGGTTSTSPVVTSSDAQSDYNAKLTAYQNAANQVNAATTANARQAAINSMMQAETDFRNTQIMQNQKNIDTTNDQNQQTIDQKNAVLGFGNSTSPTDTSTSSTSTTPTTGTNTGTTGTGGTTTGTTSGTTGTTSGGNTSSGNGTGLSSDQSSALTTEQNQLATIQAQKDSITQSQLNLLSQIQQGTIPLTPAQNTVITSLQNQLAQNTIYQQVANSSVVGAVTESMARSGGEYTPAQSAQEINSAITSGVSKIQALDNSAAQTMAQLEMQFQQQDYTEINAGYDLLQTQLTDKANTVTTMYTQTTAALKDARDYALSVAQFNETQFKDAQTLADSRYDFEPVQNAFGQRIGTQAYDKQSGQPVGNTILDPGQTSDNPLVPSTPTVTTDPTTGAPDPTAQQAYLQSIPQNMRSLVQGIANGSIQAPSARTATGAEILSMVAQYDPTLSDGSGGFNQTTYEARLSMTKALANTTSGSLGANIDSGNKFVSHLASFMNASAPLENFAVDTGSKQINEVMGLFNPTIKSAEGNAGTVSVGLTDELSKFFGGTGGTTVSSISDWGKQIDPNVSPATMKGVAQGAISLFGGQLMTYINQYSSTMGVNPQVAFSKLVQPQAMQTLSAFKNAGYDMGEMSQYVPYTDASAYIAADPANQQTLASVVKEYPNLSQAQALQLAQAQ